MAYIHINLTPYSELENKQWYVIEIACVVLVFMIMNGFSGVVVKNINSQIAGIQEQQQSAESSIADLEALRDGVVDLTKEVSELENRLAAIKSTDLMGMNQYESVMMLEIMHTLKPSGVWFKNMEIDPSGNTVKLSVYAIELGHIAEFYRALSSTQKENSQNNDIRSKVSFREIGLDQIKESTQSILGVSSQSLSVQEFDLELYYDMSTS